MLLKLFHGKDFKASTVCFFSPLSEITLERAARLLVGNTFRMRGGSRIRVRKNAILTIGDNVSINHGDIVVCREKITIGNNVQLGPNVLIYDHDHMYSSSEGVLPGQYKTEEIEIGDNVWIGANCVILRGTRIGANSVVGAGSVIKGEIPCGTVLIQKRENIICEINK